MSGVGHRERIRRYSAGGAVSLLGGGLLAVPAYDIWDDATNLSWSMVTTLAENAPFLLLAAVFLASGVWLIRNDWETARVTQVARRTLLATVVVGFLMGWAVYLQLIVMEGTKPYVIALDGVVVGAATSLALSVASTRADVHEREAAAATEQTERLEFLYDAANELESAQSHEDAYGIVADAFRAAFPNPSYRIRVDGEVVLDERRPTGPEEPTETIAIGERGAIELWDGVADHGTMLAVELFASHLDKAIQRIEREARLREERDILEFVNRTLRHDLVGDISLVQARLRMLDRKVTFHDDSHAEHLRVALDRTTQMDEFVQTMRTYMESVMNEDHSLEAVDLGPILEEHVESFRAAYPDLSVECGDVPAVAVEADDLLDRVFDNLLTNAVEHNDSPAPMVTVEVELHEEVVTVRIADNGPGISDDRRESIFEKGERGSGSDGDGFGLYLVKDVVESYGGAIRVSDNDPHGTVFELDLPLANTTAAGNGESAVTGQR